MAFGKSSALDHTKSSGTMADGVTRAQTEKKSSGPQLRAHAVALWEAWRNDWQRTWSVANLGQEVLAGFTVAAVALPLNIALAVACGLPPAAGLVAGIVGGAAAALFGGAPLQVTGPAAALNVMVLAIVANFGAVGAAAAALTVGVMQWGLSFARAARFMRFVPEALLAGFTTGVGLKLLDTQLPILLGLQIPLDTLIKHGFDPRWLHDVSGAALMSGLLVVVAVLACRAWPRVPAALIGIGLATTVSLYLAWDLPRVGVIPSTWAAPSWPALSWDAWSKLLVQVLPLGLLATVESLLSAKALDRMRPKERPHDGNLETFGQGVANIASGLSGGMPVSGVIVRSSVNVQCGARTRLSAFAHAMILLGAMMFVGQAIGSIPLAALAGLLCVVGSRLIEGGHLWHFLRHDKPAALVFLVAAVGTMSGYLATGLALALVLHFVLSRKQAAAPAAAAAAVVMPESLRAIIGSSVSEDSQSPIATPSAPGWLAKIRARAQGAASAFVHHRASVIGHVVVGEEVHIAAECSVRADEGSPFFIGSRSNIQDGAVMHGLRDRWVSVDGKLWSVYVGENVSVAHQALVHGPCYVGDGSFVGFQAIVHDAVVGPRCFIGIGARIVGVDIPAGKFIPHGAVIDTKEKVLALADAKEEHDRFNAEVITVNRGLAAAYRREAEQGNA